MTKDNGEQNDRLIKAEVFSLLSFGSSEIMVVRLWIVKLEVFKTDGVAEIVENPQIAASNDKQ